MKLLFCLLSLIALIYLWCALRVASDVDDEMGYDDVVD